METTNLTPLQKLVRVAEITRVIRDTHTITMPATDLFEQRTAILDSVSVPPLALITSDDPPNPEAWARAWADYFGDCSPETSYAWFSGAILAGHKHGHAQGHREANQALPSGMKELVDLLGFIRAGADAGKIRSPFMVDPTKPVGSPAMNLSEMITETLRTAGLE